LGARLLMELAEVSEIAEVVKVQPPDGLVVRDITGAVWNVNIYRAGEE
jgi:hypothetical protein